MVRSDGNNGDCMRTPCDLHGEWRKQSINAQGKSIRSGEKKNGTNRLRRQDLMAEACFARDAEQHHRPVGRPLRLKK